MYRLSLTKKIRLNFRDEINSFCLFQGNLSVTENIEATWFIIKKVAPLINVKIVIAGKNPPQKLIDAVVGMTNIVILPNPSQQKMETLIQTAQVNLLFTFQQNRDQT